MVPWHPPPPLPACGERGGGLDTILPQLWRASIFLTLGSQRCWQVLCPEDLDYCSAQSWSSRAGRPVLICRRRQPRAFSMSDSVMLINWQMILISVLMYIIDNPNMLQNFLAWRSNNSAVSYMCFQVRFHSTGNLSNYHHSFTFTGLETGSRWLLAVLVGNIVQPEQRWYKRSLLLVRGSRDRCIWSQPMADQVPLKRRFVCLWSCHYATLKFLNCLSAF